MPTDELMNRLLAEIDEVDGPLSVEAIHRLADASDLAEPLSISAAADLVELSPHTLRYYERIGLVTPDRDSAGVRVYPPEAVRRLVFVARMRLSGMGIRDLQHYVELVDAGDATVPERLDMLLEHRDTIRRQLRSLTLSLAATEYKIASYGGHAGEQ